MRWVDREPVVGDIIRVKPTLEETLYKRVRITHLDIGIVIKNPNNTDAICDFPNTGHNYWRGLLTEFLVLETH